MGNKIDTVMILGSSGQLGSEVSVAFADKRLLQPSHRDLPIESESALTVALDEAHPQVVINCTAFHQVDQCEADPERAFAINALSVGRLARQCGERGITFATISTDYVFSGKSSQPYGESDGTGPLNVYGASKLAGEHLCQVLGLNSFVFRTSGVFGRTGFSNKGPTFVERMISMAEKGERIAVVDNIYFSPSYTVHVAAAMRVIIEKETGGLFHLTNSGVCSWYDLAVEAVHAAGLTAAVERTTYAERAGAIKRPLRSPLRSEELLRRGYGELPKWQDGVAEYVRQRSHNRGAV